MPERSTLVVAISGCSSSGKTTLSRLLRDIWPHSFILHEDDFYWPDNQIPVHDGVQDWDCLQAINLDFLHKSLAHIRDHSESPAELVSKEDKNDVGACPVDRQVLHEWKSKAAELATRSLPRIAIIDGFLLFSRDMADLQPLFNLKLFLRTTFDKAKSRREARSGYVTVEGFWEDPPGYVENVVWPNYVRDHAFLFENGNVDGPISESARKEAGIEVMPSVADGDMTKCLQWACSLIHSQLRVVIDGSR